MVFSKLKHWSTSPGFKADRLPLSADCFNWKISNFRRSSLIFSCEGQWTLWVMTWNCRKTQAWHCQTFIYVAKHKHVSLPMILSCIVEVKGLFTPRTTWQNNNNKNSFYMLLVLRDQNLFISVMLVLDDLQYETQIFLHNLLGLLYLNL